MLHVAFDFSVDSLEETDAYPPQNGQGSKAGLSGIVETPRVKPQAAARGVADSCDKLGSRHGNDGTHFPDRRPERGVIVVFFPHKLTTGVYSIYHGTEAYS